MHKLTGLHWVLLTCASTSIVLLLSAGDVHHPLLAYWMQGLQIFVNSTSTSLIQLVCMHKFQISLQNLALVQTLFALGLSFASLGAVFGCSLPPSPQPSIRFCSFVHPPALCCCFQLGMCITHCLHTGCRDCMNL